MDIFSAIQYVGTPIALVAFVVAVVAYAYRARLVERRKLIEAAPEAERARLLDAAIRDFTTVNTETLTREQRYNLAVKLIDERAARFRIAAVAGVLTAVILAIVVVVLPASGEEEPLSLVVRLSDPAGNFITSGELTMDAGEERETRAVGSDGQVRFENLPRAAFDRGISLVPRVPGFEPTPTVLRELPEGGVHYLRLAPRATRVFGTVIDSAHAPLAGVVLLFEDGTADTTDANGAFAVLLPQAAGASVLIRGVRNGVVGFHDRVVLPDSAALTLRFQATS